MKIIFTKEACWLEKWDKFVSENEHGSHLLLSDWLNSYKSYGFDFELQLCLENEQIIGGYGAVIAKFLMFKFYIVPYGPIVLKEDKTILKHLIKNISIRAKELKTCYCQITVPSFFEVETNSNQISFFEKHHFRKGNRFKYVFSFVGLNWLDLKKYLKTEDILSDFKSSVRRDIRSAERKQVVISYASDQSEIKLAYEICLENAKKANYALRDWQDIKETIFALIEKGAGKFIVGTKDNEIKGAIFLIKTGGYYSYIFGGSKKEKPDLLVGHLLQWEAIKLSFLENCNGYNLSLGGSKGVQEFKNGFNTKQLVAEDSKYYIINRPILFSLFNFIEKYLKPYKSRIAKILASVKKIT